MTELEFLKSKIEEIRAYCESQDATPVRGWLNDYEQGRSDVADTILDLLTDI